MFLFLKKDQRNYAYAATDRFDGTLDMRRSIRGNDFKLIYNDDTTTPIYRKVNYRQKMKTMQILDSLQLNKQLNTYFSNWFSKNKDRFELYKVSEDYYEVDNLMHNPKYDSIYKILHYNLFRWMEESDFGNISESAMLDSMFTFSMFVPKLVIPKIVKNDFGYLIESNNLYTSIGWRNKNETVWNIYTTDELIKPLSDFEVLLFRPGYEVLIKTFKK